MYCTNENPQRVENSGRIELAGVLHEIEGRQDRDELLCELVRIYDNLRPSYSSSSKLEIGGIAVPTATIRAIVAAQARNVHHSFICAC
jgi:hypothetical protein